MTQIETPTRFEVVDRKSGRVVMDTDDKLKLKGIDADRFEVRKHLVCGPESEEK